jgi:hypothetical protein
LHVRLENAANGLVTSLEEVVTCDTEARRETEGCQVINTDVEDESLQQLVKSLEEKKAFNATLHTDLEKDEKARDGTQKKIEELEAAKAALEASKATLEASVLKFTQDITENDAETQKLEKEIEAKKEAHRVSKEKLTSACDVNEEETLALKTRVFDALPAKYRENYEHRKQSKDDPGAMGGCGYQEQLDHPGGFRIKTGPDSGDEAGGSSKKRPTKKKTGPDSGDEAGGSPKKKLKKKLKKS